jgi:CspA family cold shock protein
MERLNGVTKFFDTKKGFGFITGEDGKDYFVHFRSIRGTGFKNLTEGQAVTFELKKGDKGIMADNVDVI